MKEMHLKFVSSFKISQIKRFGEHFEAIAYVLMYIWVLLVVYIHIMYFRHKTAHSCVNTTRANNLNRTEVIPDECSQYGVERAGFLTH